MRRWPSESCRKSPARRRKPRRRTEMLNQLPLAASQAAVSVSRTMICRRDTEPDRAGHVMPRRSLTSAIFSATAAGGSPQVKIYDRRARLSDHARHVTNHQSKVADEVSGTGENIRRAPERLQRYAPSDSSTSSHHSVSGARPEKLLRQFVPIIMAEKVLVPSDLHRIPPVDHI